LSDANHRMMGSTAFPFFIFGGTWLEKTAEFLPGSTAAATPSSETTYGSAGKPSSCRVSPSAMTRSSRLERSSSPMSPRTPRSEGIPPGPEKRFSDEDIDRLLRLAWWNWPVDVITEHIRTIWTGTAVELEQAAKDAGLLD